MEDSLDDAEVRNCMWDTLMADVNPDCNRKLYNIWAPTFDDDMADLEYRAPKLVAELIADKLKLDSKAKILDVGCGTGLLGKELAGREYKSVDGLDFSHEMVRLARKKECYESCELQKIYPEMTEAPIPEGVTHRYDLIALCSSIAPGHISPNCIPLFLPHMNKNAYVVFAMIQLPGKLPEASVYEPTIFLDYINQMCLEHGFSLTSIDEVSDFIKGRSGRLGILKKCSD